MKINWRLKSMLFSLIDVLGTEDLLYFLQRHVTRRSRFGVIKISPNWENHKNTLKKYDSYKKIFEFGAGKTLVQNLYLSDLAKEQVVVDINPMIEIDSVDLVRQKLSRFLNFRLIQP